MVSRFFVLIVVAGCTTAPTVPCPQVPPPECPEVAVAADTAPAERAVEEPVVEIPVEIELPTSEPPTVVSPPVHVAMGNDQFVLFSPLHPEGLVLAWGSSDSVQRETLARVRRELLRVRDAHPGHREVMLSAAGDVEYGDVISVMDSVRSDDRGEPLFDRVLFVVPPPAQ